MTEEKRRDYWKRNGEGLVKEIKKFVYFYNFWYNLNLV